MFDGSDVLLDHSSVFEAEWSGVFLISGMQDDRLYLLPSSWHGADRNQQHCRHSRTHADVIWNSTFNQFERAVREFVRSTYRVTAINLAYEAGTRGSS